VSEQTIKALSVRQPWADEIAEGRKTIETRTWTTSYRGPLLICSTKKPALSAAGMALAVAELVGVRPLELSDRQAAGFASMADCLAPDLLAWVLEDVMPIDPFAVSGRQRLFDVPLRDAAGNFRIIHFGGFDDEKREKRMRLQAVAVCPECSRRVPCWATTRLRVGGADGRFWHAEYGEAMGVCWGCGMFVEPDKGV